MSYADAIKKAAEAKPVAPKPAAEPVSKKATAAPAPVAPVAAPKVEKKKAEKKAVVEEEAAPKVVEEPVSLPLDIGVAASPWTAMARKPATAKPAPVPEKVEKKKAESEDRTAEKTEKAEKVEKAAVSSKTDDSEVKASRPRREAGERSGKKTEKKADKKTEEKPAAVEPVVPEVSKPLEIATVAAAGAWGKATIVSVIAAKKAEVVVAPTPAPKKSRKGAAQKESAPVAATEVAPTEKAAPVVEESAPVAAASPVEETKSSEIPDDASLEIEGATEVVEIDVEARALPQTPLSEADAPIAVLEPLHKDGDARAETPVAPIVPVAVSPVKLSTEQDQQLQKGTTVSLPVGHQKFVQPAGTFTFIGTLPAEPVAAPVEPVRAAPVRAAAAPVSSTPAHHQTAAPHYNTHNNTMNTYHNNAVPANQYNNAPQHQPAGVNAGGGYQRNGTMYFDAEPRPYNNNSYNSNTHTPSAYQGHNNVSSIGRGGYRGGYHSDVPRPNYEGGGRGGGYEGRGGYNPAYRGGGGAPRYENSGYYPPVQNNYNSAPVSHHNSHHDVGHHQQQYNNAPAGGYGGSRYNNNMAPPAHSHAYRGGGTSYPQPSSNSYTRGRGRGNSEPSAITSPGLFTGQQYGNQGQDYHHQSQQYGGHHQQQRAPQYSSAPPPSQGYNQGY